jgi:hypothetical protein
MDESEAMEAHEGVRGSANRCATSRSEHTPDVSSSRKQEHDALQLIKLGRASRTLVPSRIGRSVLAVPAPAVAAVPGRLCE